MFRASLCPSSGERPRVTACGVYLLVVLDVQNALKFIGKENVLVEICEEIYI